MNDSVDILQETGPFDQSSEKSFLSPDEVVPFSVLPPELAAELAQVRTIALVDKAYCSPDQETIVIELWRNESLGLKYRNILFFPVAGFMASQAYDAIARLKKTSPVVEILESSPKQKGRRRLLL